MKKYILLIALFCFASLQMEATVNSKMPEDSVFVFKKDMNTGFCEITFDDLTLFAEEFSFNFEKEIKPFDFDSVSFVAMEEGLRAANEVWEIIGEDVRFKINDNRNPVKNTDEGTPTRTEKKSFSNISDIEFFHSYGNIVVKESSNKQVELEIQYFDTKNKRAVYSATTTGGLLTINTEKEVDAPKGESEKSNSSINLGGWSKNNNKAKINYIISIPRNTSLNIDLKYGNVKMDKFSGAFITNLSYSNLSATSFSGTTPQIKAKYSDIKIDEAKDLYLSASYSDIRVKKGDKIEVHGNYNDYFFGDIHTITTGNSSSYGDMKIGTIVNFQGNLKYADVIIDNLVTSMDVTTAYGDITIRNVSPNLKSIIAKASYADVSISLPQNISVSLDASINYGDLVVSKKYDVKYTESSETNNRVVKKGQIGSKTPTAVIKATNNYADIRIK